ncbi:Gfo/Idh/MocA family oxidoreductase [Mesobaculum littorinae]|uniref:Gfo/Idh/MocA family oxidoreductase n=1 Tax=Mesobaculum littorinae TaxID=2486419 RepID=A0A438ALR0_9RHOB|nr:Gfo/Idh/MocA family oxidoreductase [Mesobaculum littorinae]RVV99590.1 Gfo/Idh/MocA family oxidoreductase [Mesobaculum littorinae]
MTDPIRWGILGAADFAQRHMGPAIHQAEGAVLAALATSAPAKARPFQAFQPDLAVFDDYDALLADPSIDAVYVPLPNHLHVEWTKKALAAGKHVLTEKPIALKAAEIDELIAARDASGRMAAEAFMILHHPQWQRVRHLLDDKAVGRLMHVDAKFSFDNPDMANIRNKPDTGGGGLRDIGVYTFGSVRYATHSEPLAVKARVHWENGVDVYAHVTAEFPDFGYDAMVSTRMFPRQEVTFHGNRGVLKVEVPFNANVFGEARLSLETEGKRVLTERFPGVNHYKLQVENFCTSIREGVAYPCPLEFSRGTQRMIDMVFDAAGPARDTRPSDPTES